MLPWWRLLNCRRLLHCSVFAAPPLPSLVPTQSLRFSACACLPSFCFSERASAAASKCTAAAGQRAGSSHFIVPSIYGVHHIAAAQTHPNRPPPSHHFLRSRFSCKPPASLPLPLTGPRTSRPPAGPSFHQISFYPSAERASPSAPERGSAGPSTALYNFGGPLACLLPHPCMPGLPSPLPCHIFRLQSVPVSPASLFSRFPHGILILLAWHHSFRIGTCWVAPPPASVGMALPAHVCQIFFCNCEVIPLSVLP